MDFKSKEFRYLAFRAKQGDLAARDKFVLAITPLVYSIAEKFQNRYIELEDLVQSGILEVLGAIRRYDPKKGNIATYMYSSIRGGILNALRKDGWLVRIPQNMFEQANEWRRAKDGLEKKLKREPTSEEISRECNISISRYQSISSTLNREIIFLPSNSYDKDDRYNRGYGLDSLMINGESNQDKPTRKYEAEDIIELVRSGMDYLTPHEQQAIYMRYLNTLKSGLKNNWNHNNKRMTLASVSKKMRISKEGVRYLEKKAFEKMRRYLYQHLMVSGK